MAWTVRSVSPTAALMSRIRASGSRAISTRTCPCPVSRVQAPPSSPWSSMPSDHILARGLSRVYTHEIFLALLLTGVRFGSDPDGAIGSGPSEVMQMREVSFPVDLVRGVPVVATPEEIDITNADELRTALLEAAGLEAAGLEAAGLEAAGLEAAGLEAAGLEAGGYR